MRLKHFLSVFLTLLTLSVGQMWADYSVMFKTLNSEESSVATISKTNHIYSGGDYISAISGAKIFRGTSSDGLRFATSNDPGNVLLTLSSTGTSKGQVKASKITFIGAKSYGTDGSSLKYTISYTDNSDPATGTISLSTSGDKDVNLNSDKTIASVKIETTAKKKRFYVKGFTIVTAAAPADPVDPTITPTNGEVEVDAELDVSTLFESNSTGTITYSITAGSSYASLSGSTLTGTAVGSVTIQASQAATTGYNAKTATCTVSVVPALSKITITQNEVASFTNTYAEYSWTAGDVSGKMYAYKNSGMQLNPNQSGSYIYNTDPIPGKIRKISMTKASGTTRTWTPYVSTTALTTTDSEKALTSKEVGSTTTWDVTGDNKYFYLTLTGGATVIGSIVISYEPCTSLGQINGSVSKTHNTATLTWDKKDNVTWEVTYKADGGSVSSANVTISNADASHKQAVITDLSSNTHYEFYVRAYNATGYCETEKTWTLDGTTDPSWTITASANEDLYGEVSRDGSTITGTPAQYCRYASPAFTLTGTATVTQGTGENINKFYVTGQESDITVVINFEPIAVTNVELNSNAETLEYNGTVTLTPTVSPDGANPGVTWESSDPTVATVSNGTVTATQKAGTTIITCKSSAYPAQLANCTITVVPVTEYKKVTANLDDWSGEYLLVYENSETDAWVYTGVDAANNYATATISNNKISKPAGGAKLTIASMEGGYSIRLECSGTNNGKYLSGTSGSNTTNFDNDASANTLGYSTDHATITSNTSNLTFNSADNNLRFRYFKSTSTMADVQLYRKVVTSVVTITAPAEGTGALTLADGQTAVASGDNIEAGTQLTVTATPNGDNHYIGGTIVVKKTSDNSDVPNSVWNGTTLTMPEYAITVSASFTPTYAITQSGSGGTIAWETSAGSGNLPAYFAEGTDIVITANADNTHTFTSLSLSNNVENPDIDGNVAMFSMPASDVTATVEFTEKQDPSVAVKNDVTSLTFGPVADNVSCDAQTFTISGLNLEAGKLTVASNNNKFVISSTALDENGQMDVEGTLAETVITVTPVTNVAGVFNGKVTISGGGLENAVEITLSLTVQQTYTAKWYVNGAEQLGSTVTVVAGTPLTFPAVTPPGACAGTVFKGWLTAPLAQASATAPTGLITTYTGHTMPAAAVNYYAVFAEQDSEGAPEGYSLSASAPADGDQVIIARLVSGTYYGLTNAANPSTSALIISDGIVSEPSTTVIWDVKEATSGVYLKKGSDYLHMNSSALKVAAETNNGDIVFSANGNGSFKGTRADEARWIVTSGTNGLGCSDAESNAAALYVFKYSAASGPTYSNYVTTCVACSNVSLVEAGETNGTITLKEGTKAVNSVKTCNGAVTLTTNAVAATGFELTNITVNGVANVTVSQDLTEITIPVNATGELTVTATFSPIDYIVTVNQTEGAGATLSGATDEANYGETINLSATNIPANAQFVNWTSEDVEITNPTSATGASFSMPAKDVTVTANFIAVHNVAWAIENTPAQGDDPLEGVYVKGIISSMGSETEGIQITGKYNNATYYISDLDENGNPINSYEVYRGNNVGNTDFATVNDLTVGDEVVVYGTLKTYSSVKEFDAGNYIIANGRTAASLSSVVVSAPDASQVKTEYFTGETFLYAGLNARAVYNTGYQKDVTAAATFKANGSASLTVTANATVNVTATWSETTSADYPVTISVTTKVLQPELTLSESALTGYLGQALPKPTTITAHFVDNEVPSTENVTLQAVIDENDVYSASSTAEQTIPVKYTFGPNTATANYTVTLSSIVNTLGTAYSVAQAKEIIDIDRAEGNDLDLEVEGNKVYVTGVVTSKSGSGPYTIQIKDNAADEAFLELYKCTFNGVTSVEVGDVVKAYGNLKWFANLSKYELDEGCEVVAVVRTPNLTVADVAEMEVNITADLAEADLTIDKDGSDGAITFSCSDAAVTIVNNKLHAAAAGDATVTATIAADGIYTAATTTFNVHVIAERDRYAITMDANGGSGTDPEYAKQLEGATVDLPATNTYSKANSAFAGWVVNDGAVEITDGHFTMPAAAVTIKATWNDVETCHISFQVSGGEVATADAPQTAAYSLDGVSHPTVEGFTFIGWSETEYDDETTTMPTTITSYTPALNESNKTLYGIYSQVVGGASNKHYVLDYAEEELGSNTNWGAYTTAYDYTAADGGEWTIKAYKNSGMQINTGKSAYIKVPECATNIIQISLTCNSSAKAALKFAETTSGDVLATGTESTSQTLDLSGESVTTGYILPTGNCQITHIDVEYSGNVTYYTSSPITRYTITYAKGDATGVEGLCEAQRKAAGTINLCDAPTCADKNFVKWSDGTSLYDAGAQYTLSADVTFTATWTPKPKYTVTYTANGGTGTAPAVEEYMEGETVTVKENTYFSKPGFDYDGWLIVYNNGVSDQEITPENGEFEMVAYNVTIKAKWAEESKQKWALVTDVADLKAGDKYIIAAAGSNVAMAGQNTNNRAETAVVKRNEGAQLKGTSSMQVITLAGTTGAWEFNTGAGYLYAAGSGKGNNYLRTQEENDANGKWTITISEGVATITATGTNTNNQLKYNSGSSIFSCYSSGQASVALYKEIPMTVINDNSKDQDDVPDGGDMTIKEDKTWTVTEDKEVGDLYMEDGAIIANSAKVEANDLYFKTKKGKSNQIVDASQLNVIGDLYYDVQLCDGDLDADYWYSIAVPFDVDLNSGVFQADGSPMTNRVDFEVWGYDTQLRAQTQSNGWKRVNDNMMHAGKAYLIGFNPGQTNTIRLKAADGWKTSLYDPAENENKMSVVSTGSGDHDNWNGLANPTMRYIDVNKKTEVFNNNTHEWDSYDPEALSFNFVVGTAFFVQSASAVTISNEDHGQYRAPKRENENKCAYAVRITRDEADEFDNQIIVRASEEATGEYTQGHDMLTMNGTSSNTAALLWTENYGGKRLAIEEAAWLNGTASYVLKMFAPAAGTYSISVAEAKANADLYLTYEGSIIWNLSMGEYTVDLKKGTTEGYGLLLQAKAPGAATGVDNIDASEAAQKVIINDHVYILRNGQMYGVDGKVVR